jgi:hypothetical protein
MKLLLLIILLYKLPYFYILFVYFCCFSLRTLANFVIGFWGVKFTR